MRLFKTTLITLVVCLVSIPLLSCASKSGSVDVTEDQAATVQRGNLIIDITAVGNLALSLKENLAFEISGTVEEVLVEEGDSVEEGQVLAKLDTSEWEEQLDALERSVTSAERNLTSAERGLTSAERKLATANISLLQTDINLKNAQIAYDEARRIYMGYNWLYQTTVSKEELDIKELQIELAEMRLAEAQNAVADARQAIVDAEQAIVDAQQTVQDTQAELDEAKAASPAITAPFAGFITRVNIDGGDEVMKGKVAVQLADPNKFEADLMISEMDILQVKLGGEARVQVDAMPGLSLPAEVTHISPTATIQSGVVNYRVRVEIQSLESVMQERREMMPDISSGELPSRLEQAVEEGRITQEQVEEMIEQMQQGQQPQAQMPGMLTEDFQLREGLTVTVSILVDERNDVLLVPSQTITRQGQETYVQVLEGGVIEERLVTTGLSDWQYTEVTSGLSEGERVVAPQGTTTPQQEERMPFFPGGGMRR